jgi:hypothetical protein
MSAIWGKLTTPTAFRVFSLVLFLYLCIAVFGRTESWWKVLIDGAGLFWLNWCLGYYSAKPKKGQP